MAKRGKGGGGKRSFIRDAIGRFAKAAAGELTKAGRDALKEGADELNRVAKDGARAAVRAAEEEFKSAARNYRQARKSSDLPSDEVEAIVGRYEKAIKAKARAKAKLAGLEKQ